MKVSAERPEKTTEGSKLWHAIHLNLMKLRGYDPLQPHLIKLFEKIGDQKKNMLRRELL